MGSRGGGSTLAQKLNELREALGDYYGTLNELQLGLNVPVPEKPEAMIYYEQMEALGIPLVDGGVLDQPYIFMQEYKIVADFKKQQELIRLKAAANEGGGD